jgi:hypothetical protein
LFDAKTNTSKPLELGQCIVHFPMPGIPVESGVGIAQAAV